MEYMAEPSPRRQTTGCFSASATPTAAGSPQPNPPLAHRVKAFGSEYREMLLHCGPVRGRLLDDNYVATHRTRDLLHCKFRFYWVFGQDRNYVTSDLQLFARGFGQAL